MGSGSKSIGGNLVAQKDVRPRDDFIWNDFLS